MSTFLTFAVNMISMFKNKASISKLSSVNRNLILTDSEEEQRKIENFLQMKLDGYNKDIQNFMEI